MAKAGELTEKQKIFCREYVYDFNGARAARVAGYSEDTAKEMACENLTKPHIQEEIKRLQGNTAELAGISRLMLASELKKIAFSSIAHLHDTWITRKEFEKLTEDQKACIQEISTQIKTSRNADGTLEENEYVKVKLYDKQRAIDSLTKMFGYAEPDNLQVDDRRKQTFEIGGQKIEF
jgi:phage terminase small subunit